MRAYGIIHGYKLFKPEIMLQQADLIQSRFHRPVHKLPDPLQCIGSPFNMNMTVNHMLYYSCYLLIPNTSDRNCCCEEASGIRFRSKNKS